LKIAGDIAKKGDPLPVRREGRHQRAANIKVSSKILHDYFPLTNYFKLFGQFFPLLYNTPLLQIGKSGSKSCEL
jgi:hypothetical protein